MRRTGSRESRDSRDASATSPTSMAVKTFSIRFGSRRNQRPVHQKIRSITTVSAIIDTIRIGHMIGPPLLNLSTSQLPLVGPVAYGSAAGALALGDGARLPLNVAAILAPGAAGTPGDVPAGGGGMGAPGWAGAPAAGCPAGG